MTFPKKIVVWLPPLVWASLIFVVSSFQTVKTSQFFWHDFLLKKTAHFIEYAILFTLTYRSLRNTTHYKQTQILLLSLIISISYAISDELHQTLVPTREGRLRDVIIDTSGALFSLIFINRYLPKLPQPIKKLVYKLDLI